MERGIVNWLALLTGLVLSIIAAYFSIVGLTAFFAGAFWSIIAMGSALEIGKLIAVSWLYNYWDEASKILKGYMFAAIIILMAITSMGIFGFLSRAHIEHTVEISSLSTVDISTLEVSEQVQLSKVENVKTKIKTLDDTISKLNPKTALKEIDKREKDRDKLVENLEKESEILAEIRGKKLISESEKSKKEAELGPLKYVAELFFDGSDNQSLDFAVKLVIIVLIIVFDPLAICLLLAFNIGKINDQEITFIEYKQPVKRRRKKEEFLQ